MPLASSRATRQARYSDNTAWVAAGAEASASNSSVGIASMPSKGSANTSRRTEAACCSCCPERPAISTLRVAASLMRSPAVTARWSCSIKLR